MTTKSTAFPPKVAKSLKVYVYRLIDPRNGETFYVGKGKGDRVFSHINQEDELGGDELDNKLKRIRAIKLAGLEVNHVIHRHGLDDETAFEVEAALIEAYPGLTNNVGGHGSGDRGVAHASELIKRYSAETAVFRHKALLINISRSAEETSLYEATRYAWKLSKSRARKAEVVLPVVQGLIVRAFVPREWLDATAANFPGREDAPGRIGFVGEEAPPEIGRLYIDKQIPDKYRKPGSANPVRYTW